ncbi:hypothetical protein GCM10027048_28070 [Hymenobacter coalescens]
MTTEELDKMQALADTLKPFLPLRHTTCTPEARGHRASYAVLESVQTSDNALKILMPAVSLRCLSAEPYYTADGDIMGYSPSANTTAFVAGVANVVNAFPAILTALRAAAPSPVGGAAASVADMEPRDYLHSLTVYPFRDPDGDLVYKAEDVEIVVNQLLQTSLRSASPVPAPVGGAAALLWEADEELDSVLACNIPEADQLAYEAELMAMLRQRAYVHGGVVLSEADVRILLRAYRRAALRSASPVPAPVGGAAVQVTDNWFDGPHPNPSHRFVLGVRYDPQERTVTLPGIPEMVARVGDWLVKPWADSPYCEVWSNEKYQAIAGNASTDSIVHLVSCFGAALQTKLLAAREKYGYHADDWLQTDWEDECRQGLLNHIAKGDPRDVAAYCAFMWHHGWSTAGSASPVVGEGAAAGSEETWISEMRAKLEEWQAQINEAYACDKDAAHDAEVYVPQLLGLLPAAPALPTDSTQTGEEVTNG